MCMGHWNKDHNFVFHQERMQMQRKKSVLHILHSISRTYFLLRLLCGLYHLHHNDNSHHRIEVHSLKFQDWFEHINIQFSININILQQVHFKQYYTIISNFTISLLDVSFGVAVAVFLTQSAVQKTIMVCLESKCNTCSIISARTRTCISVGHMAYVCMP